MIEARWLHACEDFVGIGFEFAQSGFDTDFPDRSGARIHFTRFNALSRALREFFRRGKGPQEQVGIQQNPHHYRPSKVDRVSSSSGALKSSGTLILPFSRPRCFLRIGAAMGDSRAIGLPALAMMISAPAATSVLLDRAIQRTISAFRMYHFLVIRAST